MNFSRAAYSLEKAGKKQNKTHVDEIFQTLKSEYGHLCRFIKQLYESEQRSG